MKKKQTLKSKVEFTQYDFVLIKPVEFKKKDMLSKLSVEAYKYGNILKISEWESENGLEYILTIDVYEDASRN